VTLDPNNRKPFEEIFKGDSCACIGTVTDDLAMVVRGLEQQTIISVPVTELKTAWKKPFGDLI
jgi:phosphoribosylformylglycinamidine synthase